jgi:SAM-dependent methyltransferase
MRVVALPFRVEFISRKLDSSAFVMHYIPQSIDAHCHHFWQECAIMNLNPYATAFWQWFLQLLHAMWRSAELRYDRWYAKTYRPEQEATLELKLLTNKKLKGLDGYAADTGMLHIMNWFILLAVCALVVIATTDIIQRPHLWEGYIVLMIFPIFLLLMQFVVAPDGARLYLRQALMPVWRHRAVTVLRQRYRYFYLNGDKMVFTNAKPFFLFTGTPYERTDVEWIAYRKNRIRVALDWAIMSTFYLRFMWPFDLSPIQLAFLAYWWAPRKVGFSKGQKVLVIGSGPLPYHCWWKSRIGNDGYIVALDLDPYVNGMARAVERVFEFLRGLLLGRRFVSTYVTGNSEDLPFACGTFDIVVAIRCYHVNFEEALRVLKPQGKLLVDDFSQVAKVDRDKQQIAENTGLEGSIVAQKVEESKDNNFGFNAVTHEYVDLVKAGVIVPTKVERVALQNAASISGLLLTTDCAITEIKDKKSKVPAGGGMDDMDY